MGLLRASKVRASPVGAGRGGCCRRGKPCRVSPAFVGGGDLWSGCPVMWVPPFYSPALGLGCAAAPTSVTLSSPPLRTVWPWQKVRDTWGEGSCSPGRVLTTSPWVPLGGKQGAQPVPAHLGHVGAVAVSGSCTGLASGATCPAGAGSGAAWGAACCRPTLLTALLHAVCPARRALPGGWGWGCVPAVPQVQRPPAARAPQPQVAAQQPEEQEVHLQPGTGWGSPEPCSVLGDTPLRPACRP